MAKSSINILLADDDKDDCFLFYEALEELSISVVLTIVQNGDELIQQLTDSNSKLPHALFLDLNMPRKNGYECLSEIMINKRLKNLPVIIFSTSFDQEIANHLHRNGAYYYLQKPTEFSKLKKLIGTVLKDIAKPKVTKPSKENFVLNA